MDFKKKPNPKLQLASIKKCAKKQSKKHLAESFLNAWMKLKLPAPVQEHKFHDVRKWRFDFAWLDEKLAVEIDGGSFSGGGHNRPIQQAKDYEKQNMAISMGWRVVRFNTHSLKDVDLCVRHAALILMGEIID